MNLQEKLANLNMHHSEHSIDLYKRHLFAALQDLSWPVVTAYKSDYYVDALTIDSLPNKMVDIKTIIIWYAWRDYGTHLWIQDNNGDWQMSDYKIRSYLKYDTHAIKVMIAPHRLNNYVQFMYAWIKGE